MRGTPPGCHGGVSVSTTKQEGFDFALAKLLLYDLVAGETE
jgi:hypothetical protein